MPDCHFYFASTPLHVFLSSAIALTRPNDQHILLMIDQPEVDNNLYFTGVQRWASSPFEASHIFEGRVKGLRKKIQSRKRIFAQIKALIEQYNPKFLYTGNDRRIEFQYGMSQANDAVGCYIDEGTFTYVGRKASSQMGDAIFDNIGKKLTYGFFWKNPPTIGGSAWVRDVYVAFPDLIYQGLKHKNIIHLEPEWLQNDALRQFSDGILSLQSYSPDALSGLAMLIALPHESLLVDSVSSWQSIITKLQASSAKVAVKYHPRDLHTDVLNLSTQNHLIEIPRKINFESLIPHIPEDCVIIGDFSSVLINAKWLKPSLTIKAVADERNAMAERFTAFYKALGIDILLLDELMQD